MHADSNQAIRFTHQKCQQHAWKREDMRKLRAAQGIGRGHATL